MSHYYKDDDTVAPVFEVPKKTAGTRPTTVADAKKLNLIPSVTTVMKVVAKPQLDEWKQRQVLEAALTLPQQDGEGLDAFATRVIRDAKEMTHAAADFGSLIHHTIEQYLVSGEEPRMDTLLPYWYYIKRWINSNVATVHFAEKRMRHDELGVAGTCDVSFEAMGDLRVAIEEAGLDPAVVVADFKTRDASYTPLKRHPDGGEWRFASYPEDASQLWVYGDMVEAGSNMPRVSIYINRSTPMDVQFKLWKADDLRKAERRFRAIVACWYALNDFDRHAGAN